MAIASTIEAGAAAFLQKPVEQDKLMAAVQQVTGTT
jgi:FixJ family two-component response regulator